MTIPSERTNAVNKVRDFLRDLMSSVKTKRVPAYVRVLARDLLKHYPSELDLLTSSNKLPKVWGNPKVKDGGTTK